MNERPTSGMSEIEFLTTPSCSNVQNRILKISFLVSLIPFNQINTVPACSTKNTTAQCLEQIGDA
jgi:hypothetical protein